MVTPDRAWVTGARMAPAVARCGVMVQPFLPQIAAQGELSFIFFRKEFSHAVVKRPRSGEFRVQPDFGGSADPFEAPSSLVRQAAQAVQGVKGDLLYARVDGVEVDGEFQLMELEALEPDLFLGHSPGAPERFAAAVVAR